MADSPNTTPVTEISRQIVEAEIDMLIDMLDKLDADPDLEPENDDEPWIGAPNQQTGSWRGVAVSGEDDREDDPSDDEPELGWTAVQASTGRYGWDDSNAYEPSLASTNSMNQTHWWRGRMDDSEEEHDGREDCCEDEGAQCDDEGAREEDTMHSDDEVLSGHDFSPTEREAINEVYDNMRAIVKRHDPGRVVHGIRGVVTRIY